MSLGPVYAGQCICKPAPRRSWSRWSVASNILPPERIFTGTRKTRISAALCWEWEEGFPWNYGPHTNMERNLGPSLNVFIWKPHRPNCKEIRTPTPNLQICMRWEDILHLCWNGVEYISCFWRVGVGGVFCFTDSNVYLCVSLLFLLYHLCVPDILCRTQLHDPCRTSPSPYKSSH